VPARQSRREQALDLALRALSARDQSSARIEERLARRDIPRHVRRDVITTLERSGLVDDSRFACARATALAARGYGDAAIRHDLTRQGIAAEPLRQALESLEPESDRALALAEKRGRSAKTARFLASHGFAPDALEAAFGARFANNP
jgi:regulatory protein